MCQIVVTNSGGNLTKDVETKEVLTEEQLRGLMETCEVVLGQVRDGTCVLRAPRGTVNVPLRPLNSFYKRVEASTVSIRPAGGIIAINF